MKQKSLIIFMLFLLFSCNKENALLYTKGYYLSEKSILEQENKQLQNQLDSVAIKLKKENTNRLAKEDTIHTLEERLAYERSQKIALQNEVNVLQETLEFLGKNTDSLSTQLIEQQNKMLVVQKKLQEQLQNLQTEKHLQEQKVKALEQQLTTSKKDRLPIGKVLTLIGEEGKKYTALKIDLASYNLQLHLEKGRENRSKGSLDHLYQSLSKNKKEVVFLMNAGMFTPSFYPKGLYIEKGKEYVDIDRNSQGYGNFYLPDNGVFFITKQNKAGILKTNEYHFDTEKINYATQSGPMLLVNGEFNTVLGKDSPNFHFRNGIGIINDTTIVMLISEEPVRFYQLAQQFKQLGCKNALYLDGAVSGCLSKDRNNQKGSNQFGPMLSVSKK